ncbi:MAG: hypothetical protein ACK56F_16025, partial [bacterium]
MMLRSVVRAMIPEAIVIIPEISLALAHSCLRSTSYEAKTTCFVYSLPPYSNVPTSQLLFIS